MRKVVNFDGVVGLVGIVAGLVGVGYALGTRSKMAKISDRLNRSIDELANRTEIDIPTDVVNRAIEKAAENEAKRAVSQAYSEAITVVKNDIHRQVNAAVEKEYSNIKESVLKELVDEAAKIDTKRVRADVEKAAKDRALEKFDDNLEDILESFNDNLKNTSKIYNSIADSMTKNNNKEMVFRVG